jgi:hypothetical protein
VAKVTKWKILDGWAYPFRRALLDPPDKPVKLVKLSPEIGVWEGVKVITKYL